MMTMITFGKTLMMTTKAAGWLLLSGPWFPRAPGLLLVSPHSYLYATKLPAREILIFELCLFIM